MAPERAAGENAVYIGLARKWRPQIFDDLAGQQHIAKTLMNAIKTGRISQGYLFTGTRGVGKTSAARIFAKAIRCKTPPLPAVPCNQCQDCREISEGRSIDVLEIDGASNNGVDAVREIRENAKYLPSTGKYKIYIIDEVHMLTTAAFNALLKTLEEPPPHLIFVFATTDPQKIPATVLSRCMRFDFKRVSQKDLSERLALICKAENISIDAAALSILTREAEGSLRDGISLLDQIYAAGGKVITADTVSQSLGLIDKFTLLDTLKGIIHKDAILSLESVGKIHLHGFDLKQFGRELLRYLRMLMVMQLLELKKTNITSPLLDLSDVDLDDLRELVGVRDIDELDVLFSILNHGLEDIARSSIPKTVLDVIIIKMCSSADFIAVGSILSPSDLNLPQPPVSAKPAAVAVAVTVAPKPATPLQHVVPATPSSTTAPTMAAPAPALDAADFWPRLVAFVKNQKPLLGTILENVSFQSAVKNDNVVLLSVGYDKQQSFYKEQLQSPAYTELLQPVLKNFLGCAARLDYKEVSFGKSIDTVEKEKTLQTLKKRQQSILESEAMRAAQEVLGGRLEKLEIREAGSNSAK